MKKVIVEQKTKKYGMLTLLLAIFMAIGSVVYIVYRGVSNRMYDEKWKEYDECGLS